MMLRSLIIVLLLLPLAGFARVHRGKAKKTTLSIYFVDSSGHNLKASPQVQLLDIANKKVVKSFYRSVDAAGKPVPQAVPAGTFDLKVGSGSLLEHAVKIEAGKANKVSMRVVYGSLRFAYVDEDKNAVKGPVTEFDARVNNRLEKTADLPLQKCSEVTEYWPGNYYIEVNTLPISRYNVDIISKSTTEIRIPEPGTLQVTNSDSLGAVTLWAPLGKKITQFHTINVDGRQAALRLLLKPGANYEARRRLSSGKEKVTHFIIRPNTVTQVVLR